MTDAENIKFGYDIVKVDEDYIDFQLRFENPEEISIHNDKERLIVNLKGFRDEEGQLISEDIQLSVAIPNQLDPDTAIMVKDIA